MTRTVAVRAFAAARLMWAAVLLTMPQRVAKATGAERDESVSRTARVLGGRDLLQATALLAKPSRLVTRAGAVVDALHAVTAYAYAVPARSRRRPALASALVATACAAVGAALVKD